MTLVIMAAGMGSRYGGLKQIDPITEQGAFILDFSIYDALLAGFDRVVFVIKEENYDVFRETVGKRIEGKIKVDYAFQKLENIPAPHVVPAGRERPWGTGHAVLSAAELVEENFAVINADDFYGRDAFLKLAGFLRTAKAGEDGVEPFCMVGYALENTLTEHGTVSRGQCTTNAAGQLTEIVERTKIKRTETGAAYLDGDDWFALPVDTTVSMNCWGFTPKAMAYMTRYFDAFLAAEGGDPLKREFYLPSAVEGMMKDGLCRVQVLATDATWQGVTYPEDKPLVVAGIQALIADGVYPEKLW
ncbi:MAG: nucleotidyltransferase [Clostridia bacterium]|nr:nucleotidyltransferase [Clostridia bacterium]